MQISRIFDAVQFPMYLIYVQRNMHTSILKKNRLFIPYMRLVTKDFPLIFTYSKWEHVKAKETIFILEQRISKHINL